METILRYDVLKEMDSGRAFSMSFVSYDAKRRTGGELKRVVNWCKMKKEQAPMTKEARTNALSPKRYEPATTVNIYNPNIHQQHPVKVHLSLITTFNDKIVIN